MFILNQDEPPCDDVCQKISKSVVLDAIVRQFQTNWFSGRAAADEFYDDEYGEQISTTQEPTYIPMILLDTIGKEIIFDRANDINVDLQQDNGGFKQGRSDYLHQYKDIKNRSDIT